MERSIMVGNSEIKFRASAIIPRRYRFKFGRDMISDMNQLCKNFKKASAVLKEDATDEEKKEAQLSVMDLTIFENVAYILAKQADPSLPDTPDEWLDSIDGVFSIYQILPAIMELWNESLKTTSIQAKK